MRMNGHGVVGASYIGVVLLVLVGVGAVPSVTVGADRMVLAEEFTATW